MRDRGGNILRFLTLPLFAAVATALLFLVTYLDQHAEVGILAIVFVVSFLIHIGVALCFVVNFCINIGKRKFVSAASTLLAFSIMIVSLVQAQALTEKTFHGIDIVRFFFSLNYYF